MKTLHSGPCLRFGPWRFLPHRNLLERDGVRRELEHRLCALLEYFCAHPGQVLGKDTLLQAIWGRRVVNEDSLSVAVSQLRKALDDQPRPPQYIRTVPGVGYQWIGPSPGASRAVAGAGRWMAAVAALALMALATWQLWPHSTTLETEAGRDEQPYEQGRKRLASDNPEHWREAVGLFRAALEADANNAPAYVGLVEAKLRQLDHAGSTVLPHYPEMQGLLHQALDIDPAQAEARLLQANLYFLHGWDYPAANEAFRHLLRDHSDHLEGRLAYANFLLARGRFQDAMEQLQALRRLQPLLYAVPAVAWNYLMQGETELAWQEIQRITSTEPPSAGHHSSAQHIAWQRGDTALAMHHLLALMRHAGIHDRRVAVFEQLFEQGGLAKVHERLLRERETAQLGHYAPPLAWARYALVTGDQDQALSHLDDALEERQVEILWLAVDPHYQALHGHPRFDSMLERLGLSVPPS